MSYLNLCPKCGGKPVLKTDVKAFGRWYVICQSCWTSTGKYKDMETAIDRWNGGILSKFVLKPCPFCGGEAQARNMGLNLAIASCTNCPSVQQVFSCPESGMILSEEECLQGAVSMWNRRASNE